MGNYREHMRRSLGLEICIGNQMISSAIWNKALSTLIRFQTKTVLFCSVFKKICIHTYRFRINAVMPSVRMLK